MADRKKELKKANDAVQAKKNEAPTNAAEAAQNVMNQTTGLGRLKAMQDPNYEVGSYSKILFGTSPLDGGASKIAKTGMGGAPPTNASTNAAEATQNVMNQTTGLGRLKAMQDPNYEVGSYSKSLFGTSSLGGDLLSNVKSDLRKKTAKPVAKF